MRLFIAGVLAGIFLCWSAACGGGGGDTIPPPIQRTDLLYGYFGDAILADTADHTNLQWIMFEADPVAEAMRAKAAGIHNLVLAVCWRCGQDNLRFYFDGMRAAGVLHLVIALYPEDEPDLSMTESEVVDMVRMVRSVAAEYQELAQVQVWAIYGNTGKTPGIAQYDAVGRDNYGAGPQQIGAPNQRLLLVPGGASPWRESPDAYLAEANRNPRVIAIIPFLWQYPQAGQGLGISQNGMAPVYRELGLKLTR